MPRCQLSLVLAIAALACGRPETRVQGVPMSQGSSSAFYSPTGGRMPDVARLTSLGRALFFDSTLSASGHIACASCHSPDHAWGPPSETPVQFGGMAGATPGLRAVPSLGYRQDTPRFTEHSVVSDENSADQGPAGGRDWDGRASSAHEQAAGPLLSPLEMANGDRATVLARLRRSPNATALRAVFGARVFDDSTLTWNALVFALEVLQQNPADFYPYNSKYDAFLRGEVPLDPSESRGLALFNDPKKGNCAQCHPSAMDRGAFPQFTDHGFVALGVPRNARIAANADSTYFDLGLCGPLRTDLTSRGEYCGLFKTPSLRNVARRKVFFHNGAFSSLEDVLAFYARRDVAPERFYSHDRDGNARLFDDLPQKYHGNVTHDAPFNRSASQTPAFTESEAADIIAFLRTLTDGYRSAQPGTERDRGSSPNPIR